MKKLLLSLVLFSGIIYSCNENEDIVENVPKETNEVFSLLKNDKDMLNMLYQFENSFTRGQKESLKYDLEKAVIVDLGNGSKVVVAENIQQHSEQICYYYSASAEKIVFKLNSEDVKESELIMTKGPSEDCYHRTMAMLEEARKESSIIDMGIAIVEASLIGGVVLRAAVMKGCIYESRHNVA